MFLAWSYQATGNEERALDALQQALTDHALSINSTARLLFTKAWVYLAAGKLHEVEHTARHLLYIAQKADLALSQYYAHWLLGVVYYERNSPGYGGLSLLSRDRQPAPGALFGGARLPVHGLALTYRPRGWANMRRRLRAPCSM